MTDRNIPAKVAIRIKASQVDQPKVVTAEGNNITLTHPKFEAKKYQFDSVFGQDSTNGKIFDDFISPRVDQVFNGQNVVVLCYGPEQAGKTHTLFGDVAESEGIIGMAAEALFNKLANTSGEYFATTSMVQLRDDTIIDLFNPHPAESLQLLHHRAFGAYVQGAAELEVTSAKAVREYFLQGRQVRDAIVARTTSLTDPHTIMDLRFEAKDSANQFAVRQGFIRFVQVAECGVVSRRFDTGLRILTECIEGLASNQEPWHLPCDQSSITRLLQPALGGNAFTVMLGFVDPTEKAYHDTIHTLELAAKARLIKTRAIVNKSTVTAAIRELRDEIKKVRGMIDRPHAGEYFHLVNPSKITKLQLLVEELDRAKKQTWEERRKKSTKFKTERIETLKNQNLSFVLAEDTGVPPGMLKSANALLNRIVSQMNVLTDAQEEYAELRRTSGLSADQPLTDEQKNSTLGQMDKKVSDMLADIGKRKDEYRELMGKIVTIENKHRSIFLLAKDASYLEKIKEVDEWSKDISQRMENDEGFAAVLAKIEKDHEAKIADINSKYVDGADFMKLSEEATNNVKTAKELSLQELKLENERNAFLGLLIEREFRHQLNLEAFESHMLKTFENYRIDVEEEKRKVESRYHRLLTSSVTDSLKLQEENERLSQWIELKKFSR
mmetsp:Transcript_8479/g.16168  ORF Transcript_8479/g.16168 Transcript_8479/m.16168 type:complete len:667 (+) Transcript_8479:34-2034(+)